MVRTGNAQSLSFPLPRSSLPSASPPSLPPSLPSFLLRTNCLKTFLPVHRLWLSVSNRPRILQSTEGWAWKRD